MTHRPKLKWKFAIGTTSIVPGTNRREHYVIFDIDSKEHFPALEYLEVYFTESFWELKFQVVIQKTPRGCHIYTDVRLPFKELVYLLRRIPGVDPAWIAIGERRGYFFLADKDLVVLPWKVVRMVIHHGKR